VWGLVALRRGLDVDEAVVRGYRGRVSLPLIPPIASLAGSRARPISAVVGDVVAAVGQEVVAAVVSGTRCSVVEARSRRCLVGGPVR